MQIALCLSGLEIEHSPFGEHAWMVVDAPVTVIEFVEGPTIQRVETPTSDGLKKSISKIATYGLVSAVKCHT